MSVFPESERFSSSVSVLNAIDAPRLPLMVERLCDKLADAEVFSEQERAQLTAVMGLSAEDLDTLINLAVFVFQQAAYHTLNPAALATHLQDAGFTAVKAEVFSGVWAKTGPALVTRLRQRPFLPAHLASSEWQINIVMASSLLSRLKTPTALMHFNCEEGGQSKPFTVEFSQAELVTFFQNLQQIQQQLDDLASS
eukprot:CAMPEP_0177655108 /NCGR_PEP_ID=MMETSP0447-20121125/14755_1 /TAXON_ID=0 /ORGANISM="Stygamoeba regulata, Strain BSH-02190019" /LENGTH=195 /DNA_ID=CAMNT_0019158933 /DNA_START=148 /DNA_END=735 /DNA_ORIENTATION=-